MYSLIIQIICTHVPRLYRILFIILICLHYADRYCINFDKWNIFQQHNWHNHSWFFCLHDDNENEAVEAHIPRHQIPIPKNQDIQIPKPKKPLHLDSKTKKPRHRDFGTKTPRHGEIEANKPRHRDSKVFFQRTKSHNIEIPRVKNYEIEIPKRKSHIIEAQERLQVKVPRRKLEQYFTDSYHTRCMILRKITRKQKIHWSLINSFHFLSYFKKVYT